MTSTRRRNHFARFFPSSEPLRLLLQVLLGMDKKDSAFLTWSAVLRGLSQCFLPDIISTNSS
jgi:hypothetical protein